MGSHGKAAARATYSSMMRNVLTILLLLTLSSCQEWASPPSLADDTLVNTILSEKRKSGGLSLIHQNTELVAEHPPGSGRVIVLQSGPEFTPEYVHKEDANDIARELIEEEPRDKQHMHKVSPSHPRNTFNKPRLSWADPK